MEQLVTKSPSAHKGWFLERLLMYNRMLRGLFVESTQTGTEDISGPVLDQSSHHSRSASENKIQTVTSVSLAVAASAKAQTLPDIFVISVIASFPLYALLLCNALLTSQSLSCFFTLG